MAEPIEISNTVGVVEQCCYVIPDPPRERTRLGDLLGHVHTLYLNARLQSMVQVFTDSLYSHVRISGRIARRARECGLMLPMLRGLCVSVSVRHHQEPYQNGRTDPAAVWNVDSDRHQESVYQSGIRIPHGNGHVWATCSGMSTLAGGRRTEHTQRYTPGGGSDAATRCQNYCSGSLYICSLTTIYGELTQESLAWLYLRIITTLTYSNLQDGSKK